MRPDRTRTVRRALLALVLVVSGAVAWSLRRASPTAPPPRPSASGAASQGTTVSDLSFMRFKEGSREISIRAREMLGREGEAQKLSGVEVSFPYATGGRSGTATITADECLYQADPMRASFKGNVKVRTDDGLELDTDGLKYWAKEQRLFSRDEVRFRRGPVSGSSNGMDYDEETGLVLHAAVKIHMEDAAGPPADVESSQAVASKQGTIEFNDGVVVRQGGRELTSVRLLLTLSEDRSYVERAAAIDEVFVRSGAGEAVPGAPAAQSGTREMRCRRLNVAFRGKGVLKAASCVNGASLDILPGTGDPPEKRRVTAPLLSYLFDEQGQLTGVEGVPGRLTSTRVPPMAVLTSEPVPPATLPARRVQSERFTATLDPASGLVRHATFEGGVRFSEPGRRASAQKAVLDDAAGLVTLTGGEPRVEDDAQGGDLRGKEIRIGTRSRAVSATDGVRHTIPRRARGGAAGPALPLSGDEPTIVLCRQFDYDPATKSARYKDNALMRSGADEIRAPLIVVDQPGDGKGRLSATGGVQSTLHPKTKKGADKPAEPVSARSRELLYEEAARRVVYTGDVEIRQGDLITKSPEAIVLLGADGRTMEKLLAGSPVELRQGTKKANGERATYTPADETLVLVGEKVVLEDADRRLEGRVLTFQSGSDRIRVDGREEVRTEAVFKRQVPPKP
ncbi:MAG: LPS export ABC transporter periplasmic protein LptC [Vicinamibacteria bacterium]